MFNKALQDRQTLHGCCHADRGEIRFTWRQVHIGSVPDEHFHNFRILSLYSFQKRSIPVFPCINIGSVNEQLLDGINILHLNVADKRGPIILGVRPCACTCQEADKLLMTTLRRFDKGSTVGSVLINICPGFYQELCVFDVSYTSNVDQRSSPRIINSVNIRSGLNEYLSYFVRLIGRLIGVLTAVEPTEIQTFIERCPD